MLFSQHKTQRGRSVLKAKEATKKRKEKAKPSWFENFQKRFLLFFCLPSSLSALLK